MKKYLIINIFGIGDVLFTTPLISSIKAHDPSAFIGFVCNPRALQVLKNNPKINQFYIYERDDFHRLYKESRLKFLKKMIETLNDIRNERYDAVIDLSLNFFAGFFMWLIGIKTRIGFNYKNRSPLLNRKVVISGFEDTHVVEYYLGLLKFLGIPPARKNLEVNIPDEDKKWARAFLKQNGMDESKPLVALVPGGGASWGKDAHYRRWPAERHAALADKVIEKFSANVILLGDLSEENLGRDVLKEMRHKACSLVGKTSISQYLALLSLTRVVIMNDGGPLHMAVAAGAKTVSLIGPVDEHVYGPYPEEGHHVVTSDVACRPCYRHFRRADCEHISCLNNVQVDDYFKVVEQAFSA